MRTFDRDTLQEEYEDALFRLIMADWARARGEELMRESEELKKDPANNPTPAQIQKFERVTERAFRKHAVKSAFANTYKAVNKAAAVLVILIGGFLVTAMSVPSVRVGVLNFLIGFEKEYTSLRIGEGEGSSIIGENVYVSWKDAYVPTYIPEGFRITKLANEPSLKAISYLHEDGRTLHYYEFSENAEINLDTEDADSIENLTIQGHDALLVEKNGNLSATWVNGNRLFLISAEVTKEEVIRIAEAVRFIAS